jgi:hypothetical protein
VNTEDTNAQGPTAPARQRERVSRLTMMPPTGRSVLDPVPRLILAVDVEGSTLRTNLIKGEFRRTTYELLDQALRATGIDRMHMEQPIDRGDGVLLLFRPDDAVPRTLLLGQLIPQLATLLVEHNATAAEPALRLRLRAVLHAGEIHDDGWGFYGEDLDVAFRLLDSPSVRKALKNEQTFPLVLVISDEIHSGIVRHGYGGLGPCAGSIRVPVAKRRRTGWVHFPVPLPADRAKPPSNVSPLVIATPTRTAAGPEEPWEEQAPPAARMRTPLRVVAPPPTEPEELWEEPWEPALSAVYQALEQHLDETDKPYDVEAGLANLKKWMSARKTSERSPTGRAAEPVRRSVRRQAGP